MSTPRTRKPKWRSAARGSSRVDACLRRLGKRVRALRRERSLTQEATADAASLDSKHLQAIEAGNVNPTVASLLGIARALGVTLADLFEGV